MLPGFLEFLVLLVVGVAGSLGLLWIGLGIWHWYRSNVSRNNDKS